MGRKKIPCTCDPTCKSDAACKQGRSKAKRKQQALADQAFALAVAACFAAGVAAVCGAAVTAAALLIGADSQGPTVSALTALPTCTPHPRQASGCTHYYGCPAEKGAAVNDIE